MASAASLSVDPQSPSPTLESASSSCAACCATAAAAAPMQRSRAAAAGESSAGLPGASAAAPRLGAAGIGAGCLSLTAAD